MAIATGEIDRECHSCDEEQQRRRGCKEETSDPTQWFTFDDETTIKRCPLTVLDTRAVEVVQMHGYAQLGLLPEPGGVLQQPSTFLQAVAFTASLFAKAGKDNGS